jgi:hypothetical protein
MPSANNRATPYNGAAALAGLQAGTFGALLMLAWLGLSAVVQRRSFWTAANLMASTFYGDRALHSGFARSTLSGLALYVIVYAALGALFALVMNGRANALRTVLIGVLFGMGWYYLSFGVIWKRFSPLVWLLHAGRPTMFGHLMYGALAGRFPAFLPKR